VIRGAIYRVDLGEAKRGHEQRGRRYGLVLSPTSMPWSMATIIPTSGSAGPSIFRPQLEVCGGLTRFLVDQIRTIDVTYIHGDPVHYLDYDELAEIEHTVAHYLGL
jgi:mRNA interferase MazF